MPPKFQGKGPQLVTFFQGLRKGQAIGRAHGWNVLYPKDMMQTESSMQPMRITTVACGANHTVCCAAGVYDGISRVFAWGIRDEITKFPYNKAGWDR